MPAVAQVSGTQHGTGVGTSGQADNKPDRSEKPRVCQRVTYSKKSKIKRKREKNELKVLHYGGRRLHSKGDILREDYKGGGSHVGT